MGDDDTAGITCPHCSRTSRNPHDIEQGYCGNCHDWTSPPGGNNMPDADIDMDFRVVMCRPLHPDSYPTELRPVYDEILRRNGPPTVYTGSIERDCQLCSTTVEVGPKQQRQIRLWRRQRFAYRVLCFVCVVRVQQELHELAQREGANLEVETINLGNPEGARE
jgi:hypothetical protein